MSRTFTLDFNKAQLKEMEEGVSLTVPTGSIFTVRPSAFNITPDARGISVENRDKVSVIFEVAGTMPAGTVIDLELFARVYRVAIGTVTKTTAVAYTDELVQLDIEDPLLSEADYVRITYKFKQGTAYTVSRLFANVKKKLTSLTESAMEWKGVWDANTNTPALASGVGTNGDTYRVSVAGSTNLDGITDWKVGDWAIFNGGTVTWEKADNTDAVSSVHGRIGAVVAAASDYDASQIDNDSGVVGATVKDALDRLMGPFTLTDSSVVVSATDGCKRYATIPGGSDDPIVFALPDATTPNILLSFFNAAAKPMQLAANGSQIFYVPTWHTAPNKVQCDANFGFIQVLSTGLGSWVVLAATNKWKNADVVTALHRYDGNVHDGVNLIYDTDLGGHVFTTLAQRARGTLTISGGLPVADETFVINATTLTAKADGSGDIDHFTIGGTIVETIANIVATLAECSEAANLTAWIGAGKISAVIEWDKPGVVGNGITFTESMSFTSVDGGGTLGGTHAGVAAATLLVIGKDGAVDIPGSASIGANTAITDSAVTTNQLAIINSNYGTIKSSTDDGLMVAIGAGAGQGNRNLIFTDSANRSKDHDHDTLSDNPTLFGHSVRDPDESNTEWWSKTHDGDDAIYSVGHGGHTFTTQDQKARGTIDFPGGVPIADETFVINATTMTWKADGSGNVDHVTIGGNAAACVTNLVASIAECTESGNLTAWAGAADTVVVEWGTGGVAGNAIVFTEACTNMTMDGAGTLGATHAGVAAATLFDIDESGVITSKGAIRASTSVWENYRQIAALSVSAGGSGATFTPPDGNSVGGWLLDADTEKLYFGADVETDWDGASDLTVRVIWEAAVGGAGGADTVDLKLLCTFKGDGEAVVKTQTLEVPVTVGVTPQWTQWETVFTIDYDSGTDPVEGLDVFGFTLNLETDTSEVDAVIINHFEFKYKTNQPAIEA